jgi:hypothetical protein
MVWPLGVRRDSINHLIVKDPLCSRKEAGCLLLSDVSPEIDVTLDRVFVDAREFFVTE